MANQGEERYQALHQRSERFLHRWRPNLPSNNPTAVMSKKQSGCMEEQQLHSFGGRIEDGDLYKNEEVGMRRAIRGAEGLYRMGEINELLRERQANKVLGVNHDLSRLLAFRRQNWNRQPVQNIPLVYK